MNRTVLMLLALAAGCTSVDDIQKEPVRWTMDVPATWDKVGACIAMSYTSNYEVQYLPVPSESRSDIILSMSNGVARTVAAIFTIKGGQQTTVSFRRIKMVMSNEEVERIARDTTIKCGTGP